MASLRGLLEKGQARSEAFLSDGIETWVQEGRIDEARREQLLTTLNTPEIKRALFHFGVHFAISLPLRSPFGSIARFFYTLALRLRAELRGLVRRGDVRIARRNHTVPVMLFALMPGFGRLAYFLSPALASERLLLLVPLDVFARKLPFRAYRRLHLDALFSYWALPGDVGRGWRHFLYGGWFQDARRRLADMRPFALLIGVVLVVDAAALLIGAYLYVDSGEESTWWFDERNVMTTLDALQLLVGGLLGLMIYRIFWTLPNRSIKEAAGIFLWGIAGAGLILFAVDDYLGVHEEIGPKFQLVADFLDVDANMPDDALVLTYALVGLAVLSMFRMELFEDRPSATLLQLAALASVVMILTDAFATTRVFQALEYPSQTFANGLLLLAFGVRYLEVKRHEPREDDGRVALSRWMTWRLHALPALFGIARLSAFAVSIIYASLAIAQGPPEGPSVETGGAGIDRAVQYIFVCIGGLATLLAWRRPLPGGWLLVVSGVVLGIFGASRFSAETALVVAFMYAIPGSLFLFVGTTGHRPALQITYAVAVAVLLIYGGFEARARHDRAFGPAHPQSSLVSLPFDKVEWIWSGGVTSTSAIVNARLREGAREARLLVSAEASLADPKTSAYTGPDGDGVVTLSIEGLEPNTLYHYTVEVDGEVDRERDGSLRTFPEGAASFSIVVGACARTGSNGAVYDAMRGQDALFYVITGDAHYENISSADLDRFQDAYQKLVTAPAQAALYRETPIAYVWDDHDFGGGNSTSSSDAREAARLSYRQNVPHYDLPGGPGNAPIYQAFTAGRVRFILLDTRSMRRAESMPDGSPSMLGARQRSWLKQELLQASQTHGLTVVVSSVPWIAPDAAGRDDWGGYATERREIADFIAENGITNLLMLSGDAHMLAIDDGSNSDYATKGGAGFPVFHAAALDRPGSIKGGPYNEGAYPGAGQYGRVTFSDDGDVISVDLLGLNWQGDEIVSFSFRTGLRRS